MIAPMSQMWKLRPAGVHNRIVLRPPSPPINGLLASALQHPALCRKPPPTPSPTETANPGEKGLRLSRGVPEKEQDIQVQVLVLSLAGCVTLDKLFLLSDPSFLIRNTRELT